MANPYIRLMRPKHWVKNMLVLAPLVFSGGLLHLQEIASAVAAFIAFSLMASAVYVSNDLNDVDRDRKHPTKCKRPIASGLVSERAATIQAVLLVAVSLTIQCFMALPPAALLLIYLGLNIAYSRGLKQIPIVDVTILALGYLLRLYYGALCCGVAISGWLYLTVLAGSFYLGLGKRRGEWDRSGEATRGVLARYSRPFLDKNMQVYMGLTMAFYALWAREQGNAMLLSVLLVMLVFMRYSFDIEGTERDADPMGVLAGDRILMVLAAGYSVLVLVFIYFPGVMH